MTRYVLIDHYTGFVWGETDAADPIEACRKVDEEVGSEPRTYHRETLTGQSGYHVYEAPKLWISINDGQIPSQIERVERDCRKVAEVAFVAIDDLPPINPETYGDNRD